LQREHSDVDPVSVESADAGVRLMRRQIDGEASLDRDELVA